jgi:hypothetical protein
MKQRLNILVVFFVFFFSLLPKAYAQWFVDLETGLVFSGYNNVRIPGDTGTKFSLSQDLKTDPSIFIRFKLGYQIAPRHSLSILIAPLTIKPSGIIDKEIKFFEEDFPPNIQLNAEYRFNSYRLTYGYDLVSSEKWKIKIGLTAKIRDAAISLEGDDIKSEKKNLGFVPLIHFRVEWKFNTNLSLLLDGDALGAPQGRAEDILLAFQYQVNKNIGLKAGYRILEGGADVAEVYSFTLLHYVVFGTTLRF